jgi:hypothetical protein
MVVEKEKLLVVDTLFLLGELRQKDIRQDLIKEQTI